MLLLHWSVAAWAQPTPHRPFSVKLGTNDCHSFEDIAVEAIHNREGGLAWARRSAARVQRELGVGKAPASGIRVTELATGWNDGAVIDARRRTNGDWVVSRIERRFVPDGGDRVRPDGQRHDRVTVRGKGAGELDALVGMACWRDQPDYLPNILPLKGGGDARCFDGVDVLIEASMPKLRRTAYQACVARGVNGLIVGKLWDIIPRAP